MSTNPEKQKLAHSDKQDWTKMGWKHPYMIYVLLVLGLFVFLGVMGYLAVENEWIPNRGIN